MMRIKVDLDLCQGHSVCMEECPDVFDVRDQAGGYHQVVVLMENPPETGIVSACCNFPTR